MRRGRQSRAWGRAAWVVALLLAFGAGASCGSSSKDRSKDPAYMCPRLLDRCKECRQRMAGFDEWDCNGSDGAILERCKGKASARASWLEKLAGALAQDTCRDFEDAL